MAKKKATPKKKHESYEKQATKISKSCIIVSSVALALPILAIVSMLFLNLFHVWVSTEIIVAGFVAGPVLLLVSLISSTIVFSQLSYIKNNKTKKKLIATCMLLVVVAAILAFLLRSYIDAMDFSIPG